jgi:hypothetical protein
MKQRIRMSRKKSAAVELDGRLYQAGAELFVTTVAYA